jgi:hypothetical protein
VRLYGTMELLAGREEAQELGYPEGRGLEDFSIMSWQTEVLRPRTIYRAWCQHTVACPGTARSGCFGLSCRA